MNYRYNVACSETNANKWTNTAIDCYKIGCNCSKCLIYNIYFKNETFKCKMKDTVIELVRKNGIPNECEDKDEQFYNKIYF